MSSHATSLINTYSTRNLGDAAIMRSIAQLVPSRAADAVVSDQSPVSVPGVALVERLQGDGPRISVGGDIFNNSRPLLFTRNFLANVAELRKVADRTISFGQTIPSSCTGLALRKLSSALARLPSVTVRDEESHQLLNSRGVRADLSWDVAFVTRDTDSSLVRARKLYETESLDPGRTVLMSARSFDALYPCDQAKFETQMATLSRKLVWRGHQVAYVIQSDVSAADSDREVVGRIKALFPNVRILDPLAEGDDEDRVATLASILRLANIVVGVRYHTTVLRLAMGRQPFSLHYSRKGADLHKRLGLQGLHMSEGGLEDLIKDIERTADMHFDPSGISQEVADRFSSAMSTVS